MPHKYVIIISPLLLKVICFLLITLISLSLWYSFIFYSSMYFLGKCENYFFVINFSTKFFLYKDFPRFYNLNWSSPISDGLISKVTNAATSAVTEILQGLKILTWLLPLKSFDKNSENKSIFLLTHLGTKKWKKSIKSKDSGRKFILKWKVR